MGWFGPNKDEVWRQFCQEIGAEFVEGGFWKGNKVQARAGPWTITLDTHTESSGEAPATYTRLRAPFVNPGGFRFTIYRTGLFSNLGKLLGMQDIEIGDPEFDQAFIIQGNDDFKVISLFGQPEIRKLIAERPQIRLDVIDSEGWIGPSFPDDTDELHFQVVGVITDIGRLKALFDLFGAVLDQLWRIGSAAKQEPGVQL
jgi:hypothetical protein